ncbi:hypothetical protein [Rhizobium sp. BK538]|uniref:hypothetical protein n=1 Tax=Rhizobium sp. BK538 TaxID=2586984 RepID=UPI001620A71B|nr:hypothetical protein [Rhizobium sp. BK538]MBB4170789.1 hypothetical protein [Rhizobium sp. BK538]
MSTNSLKAAAEAGRTVTQALGEAFDRMLADGKISEKDRDSIRAIAAYWRAGSGKFGQHG